MPAKHQPDKPYLRHVNTRRVHLFTIIQVCSTAGLYLIKYIESLAITFPILVIYLFLYYLLRISTLKINIKVLATCVIRKLLDFVFTQRELFWLDDILPGAKHEHPKKQANGGTESNEKVVRFNNKPRLISYTPINNNDANNDNNDNSNTFTVTNTNSNSQNDNETSRLVS